MIGALWFVLFLALRERKGSSAQRSHGSVDELRREALF